MKNPVNCEYSTFEIRESQHINRPIGVNFIGMEIDSVNRLARCANSMRITKLLKEHYFTRSYIQIEINAKHIFTLNHIEYNWCTLHTLNLILHFSSHKENFTK
jgi:hypothetical protein